MRKAGIFMVAALFSACAAVAGGASKGFNDGLNSGSSEGCSSASDCYSGQVCMIPKGQYRGTCMEVR